MCIYVFMCIHKRPPRRAVGCVLRVPRGAGPALLQSKHVSHGPLQHPYQAVPLVPPPLPAGSINIIGGSYLKNNQPITTDDIPRCSILERSYYEDVRTRSRMSPLQTPYPDYSRVIGPRRARPGPGPHTPAFSLWRERGCS